MKTDSSTNRMIFADPAHTRLFRLAVVLFAFILIILYLYLFYPVPLRAFFYIYLIPFRYIFLHTVNRLMMTLLVIHYGKLFAYCLAARRSKPYVPSSRKPKVCAVIPAFNEEKVIVNTIRSVLASDYGPLTVWVVDDGSTDRTAEVVEEVFKNENRVRLLRQKNSGKALALNAGIEKADCELLLLLDADTVIAPDAVRLMARHFEDRRVAAVSGSTRVGNAENFITRCQRIEYFKDFNLIKNGMSHLNCMAVVPGALGMWRRSAVLKAGGFSPRTLGEDRDLTMTLAAGGSKLLFEPLAFSWTEAPSTIRAFTKQRYRWTYGTLQCLAAHMRSFFSLTAPGMGFLLLPDLLIFQTAVPCLAAVIFLMNLGLPDRFELLLLALFYIISLLLELILYLIASLYTPERPRFSDALTVPLQRVLSGLLCSYLLYKALIAAFLGSRTGWNKLERTGNVDNTHLNQ